jgi:hypothetical protein
MNLLRSALEFLIIVSDGERYGSMTHPATGRCTVRQPYSRVETDNQFSTGKKLLFLFPSFNMSNINSKLFVVSSVYILPERKLILQQGIDYSSHLITHSSNIHGRGLFATKDIPDGHVIWKELMRDPTKAVSEDDGPLRWTNHSDEPNSALLKQYDKTREQLQLLLFAIKNIPTGEEITYDYNSFSHAGRKMECHCGRPDCTGSFVLRADWNETV